MKKITYQITVSEDEYLECSNQLEKLILFPVKGSMTFKVEEICEEDKPRPVSINGVKYSSYEDYIKSREGNKSGRKG